jgi:hypothetical protein
MEGEPITIGIRLEERLLLGLEERLCDIRAIKST